MCSSASPPISGLRSSSLATREMPRHVQKKRDVRQVPFPEDHQEYARVLRFVGNGRMKARFGDGSERLCKIRGKMKNRDWVRVGDLVLACRRVGLEGDTCDIVYKYQAEEVAYLRRVGQRIDFEDGAADDDAGVVTFEGGDDDEAVCWDDV